MGTTLSANTADCGGTEKAVQVIPLLAGYCLLAMQIDFTGNFLCFLFENGVE